MSFEPKKYKDIFDDMRSRSTVVTDFEVGSVTRTLVESFSYEIALLYEKMQLVYLSAFVDTAEGQQLDNVVAILGIQRGLPDYAEGTVTFLRDAGNQGIDIPLGTLVSTEDTPEAPKKVYQTLEARSLAADHTSVDVKVQAIERGEDEVAAAETITVMPRPLSGIKSVINREPTRFIGKRRETDEELRQRSKNALISSGKASIIALENALLSLPGVKDVQVDERFHVARGTIRVQRGDISQDLRIPKASSVTAAVGSSSKSFTTTNTVKMDAGESSVDVPVKSLLDGKAGEVSATDGVTWAFTGNDELADLSASNPQPVLLGDFGVVDIIVDGVDLTDPAEVERIRQEIDRVRAAGIFVHLRQTTRVEVDAVFRIDLTPDLELSAEERLAFEGQVQAEIARYIDELRMGQPILFAQIIKSVLSLDGVLDLADFVVTTRKVVDGEEVVFHFVPGDKRIEIEESDKLAPRFVCVASEVKTLPVHIQLKAIGGSLSPAVLANAEQALATYFGSLKVGEVVEKNDLAAVIAGAGVPIENDLLHVTAVPWCPRAPLGDGDVAVTFVERAAFGSLFAYHDFLDITGALALTLPASMTAAEKEITRQAIRAKIDAHLDALPPEADVVLEDLVALAAGVDRVLDVDVDAQDFRVAVDGVEQPARVSGDKLGVETFEKARLAFFCVTGDVETVTVALPKPVRIELLVPGGQPPAGQVDALQGAVKNAINNFLTGAAPGEDLLFDGFRAALEGLVPGASYSIKELTLQATSDSDGRAQATSLDTAADIHVRSVEMAIMTPIEKEHVEVTVVSVGSEPASPRGRA